MENQQLAPDPGPQRRMSRPFSFGGCLRAVLVVFGASGVLQAVWNAGKNVLQAVDELKLPHLALYQNETWDQVTNRSAVVRPLVSGRDRFDIIATVWLRGNASQQAAYRANRYPDAASELVEHSNDTGFLPGFAVDVYRARIQDDIFEVALYSGVIIQNATLSDKSLTVEVPLEFPLGVFLEESLTAEHLRASFVVSPSVKMDHLRNFSSWMPDYALETQWPSRPASLRPTEEKSLIDRAIDSFSVSVPMIEFYAITSHCDAMLNAAGFTNTTPAHNRWQPWSNAWWHPHVISRLHLRILDEQHVFNLETYNTVHDKLRRTSRGQGYGMLFPHRSSLRWWRTYKEVGPMETLLEFSDSHSEESEETEWAYAPFLSAAPNAAGPLDYIPVPVNRVNCSAQPSYNSTNLPVLEPSLLNDTMKVIWHISFSARTPRKMLFSDLYPSAPAVINASQSELEQIKAQVQFEHQNALRTHRFHVDSHPRRRLVAYTLGYSCATFAFLLHIVYYWRLISTVGISIRGQWLSITSFLAWTVMLMFDSSDSAAKIVTCCIYTLLSVIPLFAITRMELRWRGFTRLPVTFAHATHAERASSRIDAKSSRRFIGTSILILVMWLSLADPFQHDLIPSPLPPDPKATLPLTADKILSSGVTAAHWMSEALQLHMNHRARFGGRLLPNLSPSPLSPDPKATLPSTADNIFSSSVTAALWMSDVLQLLMNHRARAFGGMYKATVWLMVAGQVLHFTVYLPVILGHILDRAPLSLGTVIRVLPLLVQAWQAWTLPAVKMEEEEHEN
ncbi:hypothetical protein GGX14DRAFT_632720 [Mycena pura]|uniref:Uncharacterized protein n=1 Tax=Mycena pura TaxID=153505 RepID=A0AAD6VG64_9AGAR|nr:hypothetical protein GGX14DRAFT_632720 [Mycena pura]